MPIEHGQCIASSTKSELQQAAVHASIKDLTALGSCYCIYMNRSFSEILLESKFVLSPSGMGYGCYTHWEVLAHGAIPVIDTDPGFDRTFAGLPVVIVADNAD
eukprot:19278-Heterococcus_DN1.PRE.2